MVLAQTILSNGTITTNGSSTAFVGFGNDVTSLVINVTGPVTGSSPTITFTIQEIDPGNQTTTLGVSKSGAVITGVGTQIITVPNLTTGSLVISWVVTGTTPSFGGIYASLIDKIDTPYIYDLAGNGPVAVKGSGVTPLTTDPALVVSVGPNSFPLAVGAEIQSDSYPNPISIDTDTTGPNLQDAFGNLQVRGPVLTDEGSFRDDFTGSSLLATLTGTLTFTNNSTTVTGSGTLFTTELSTDNYIRLSAHANSVLARVGSVIDNTTLELETPYTGANGSGAAVKSFWLIAIPAGPASITVGSSLVNLLASTVNGTTVSLIRDGDYLPFTVTSTCSISQRVANQTIIFGFEDVPISPSQRSTFVFDGTDNTKVKCRTAFAGDSIQETTVTLPSGAVTSVSNVYQIDQNQDRTLFYINGTQVASHQTHLPSPYMVMSQVAYITNTGTVGSQTTFSVDSIFFANRDFVALDEPVNIQGVVGGQPISVQFGNPGGGTALPKIINVNYNKSDGAIVASVYKRSATYTVPASYNGYLIKYVSFQGEAATSRVVAETNMGNHNDNTNVFTGGSSYASPQWAAVVQAEVTTAYAAGSGNVVLTVGYTNESGTAGRSGTITIPKGSAIGSRWDLALQGADLGVQSIQSCSGTPTQVGISKILGLLQLAVHQDQSTTTQTETLYAPGAITFPSGTVLGMEYAGGTVSKTRFLDMLVQLVQ